MSPAALNPGEPRIVNCPACGKPVAWVAENRFRPFCSERCKSIDFGAWAADEYRVAEQGPSSETPPT